jgi:hypothetical protein
MNAGFVVPSSRAKVSMVPTVSPVMCATFSGGYSFITRFFNSSPPRQKRSIKSWSCNQSRKRTCITPSASAPSVPGRTGIHQSLAAAVLLRCGSTVTTFAPAF